MKISLLHPSRGRAIKSFTNTSEWLAKAGNVEVEVICAVDMTDPTRAEYASHYKGMCYEFPTDNVVQATNMAAKHATGDIMVYLSDDFKCPDNWAELIVKEFENENRPLVLKVDDMLQDFSKAILTIPIMNRSLYERLGWFWHPGYKSMFCDEHLFWTAHKLGAIKNCKHLKFPHHHYSNPNDTIRSDRDETYKRSEANWDQGKKLFQLHKSQGFKI